MPKDAIFYKIGDGHFGCRAAGVMVHKNRVLLSKLEDDDVWVLPGGGISIHETSEEAVKREFLEETGIEIEVERLLWILENFFVWEKDGQKYQDIGFHFLVSPKEEHGKWEQDEFSGQEEYHYPRQNWNLVFKWFASSELDRIDLKPSIFKKLLKDIPEHPIHVIHNVYGGE